MAAPTIDYPLPSYANGTLQVALAPPTSISGWAVRWDLMYRFNSPQPIISRYLASGYSNGESGITLVDGANGIFNIANNPGDVSGLTDGVLVYRTVRTDAGVETPLNGGGRLMGPY